MAKRSNKKSSYYTRHNAYSPRALSKQHYRSSPVRRSSSPLRLSPLNLLPLGNKTLYSPLPYEMKQTAIVASPKSAGRIVATKNRVIHRLSFADPNRVLVCVRRNIRKQVMHAKGYAGSKVRPPRHGPFSDVSC